jgi:hypothetical protein
LYGDGRNIANGRQLDYYLPLPGLLDPSLNDIVTPLLEDLSKALIKLEQGGHLDSNRFHRLGRSINWVIKVRGWKGVGELTRSDEFPTDLVRSSMREIAHWTGGKLEREDLDTEDH